MGRLIELNVDEHKKCILDVMSYIHNFCEEHNICYFLTDGSMLGAVRHRGFIPWDDDMDIMMPRPDYERFIKLFREKANSRYKIHSVYEKKPMFYFTKVYDTTTVKIENGIDYDRNDTLGIDVDIFPIDGQPDNSNIKEFKKDYRKRKLLCIAITLANSKLNTGSFKRRIAAFAAHLIGNRRLVDAYSKICKKYSFEDSEICGCMDFLGGIRNRHRKAIFEEKILYNFEDRKFYIPKLYDEFLSNLYGDYMTPPPIEKQISHHSNKVYRKDL